MYYQGILIGLLSFVIIGIFHPVVIKAEFYCGKKSARWFLAAGIFFCGVSFYIPSVFWSALSGLLGFTNLWSITEVVAQEKRVQKGWFPPNPKRKGKLIVREETPGDYLSVRRINESAFGRLDEAFLVEKLRANPLFEKAISLVAVKSNIVVGHVLLFPAKVIDDTKKEYDTLCLALLAVFPDFHRQGIGSALVSKGLEMAAASRFSSVFVQGDAAYCSRFGFSESSLYGLSTSVVQLGGSFQAIELKPGALSNMGGELVYPKEFNIFM